MRTGWKRGYSFLEVVIAIVIIMVGLLPVFGLMSFGNKSFKKSENNAIAYNLAVEAIEWAKSAPFDLIKVENFPVAISDFQTHDSPPKTMKYPRQYSRYYSNFEREMEIEDNYGGKSRLKKVTVTVRWKEGDVERSERLSTVVVDRRLY